LVIVRNRGEHHDPQVVAYLIGNNGAKVNEVSVRDLLRRALPSAAVPDHFVVLDALPALPSGKVDKSQLPPPVIERPAALGEVVEPRDPVEAAARTLYSEVLDLADVGVTDDFFELGGHSLAATRLAGRLPDVLGVDVPLRVLFEHPTVESLVAWARTQVPPPGTTESPMTPEELQDRLRQLKELPADVRDGLLDRW
jgi:acyl carrier protein